MPPLPPPPKGAVPIQDQTPPPPPGATPIDEGQQEQPGFFSSLGKSFGLDPESMQANAQQQKEHPIRHALEAMPGVQMGEGLIQGAKRSGGELLHGIKDASQGNPSGLVSHGISALPFVGPAMDKAAEQAPPSTPGESYLSRIGDVATNPGAMGTLIGGAAQAAPLALGAADIAAPGRGLIGEVPTTAKAGELFNSLKGDLAKQPVSLTRTGPQLQKMLQLGREGGGTVPGPARQLANAGGSGAPRSVPLLRQMQNELSGTPPPEPQPLLYPSARNFQSGLSTLSREERGAMGGPMKGQLKQVNKALYGDVRDSAENAGRAEDYVKAMRMNRQAETMNRLLKTGAKIAIPAAVGGGLVGGLINKGLLK